MGKILLFTALLGSFFCLGQSETSAHKWELGIGVRPVLNSVIISESERVNSIPQFGFSSYFISRYQIGKKWAISAGLGYGSSHYSRIDSGVILNWDIDPQQGAISSSILFEDYYCNAIELPILFQFHVTNHFYATTGLQVDYRMVRKLERSVLSTNGKHDDWMAQRPVPAVNISLMLGLGYEVPIGERFKLRIEPLIKSNFTDKLVMHNNLVDFGVQTSCFIRL